MGKYGELLLKARFDGTEAGKKIRELMKLHADSQKTIGKTTVATTRQVASAVLQAERIRTQEAKTLKELERAHDSNAKAVLSETRAQIALRRESERTTNQQKKQAGQMSKFAQAIYSSRFSLGKGVQPLVGKTAEAFGFDLKKKSTLIGATIALGANTLVEQSAGALQAIDRMVNKASDLNEAIQANNEIFKASGKTIQDWAKNAANNIGETSTVALNASNQIGVLFKSAGDSGDELVNKTRDIVQLAGDLGSFYNQDVASALENLRAGLVGESEPLRKFGIFISEARVQAEALNMGLGKTPPNLAKVREAQTALEIATAKSAEAQRKYGEGSTESASANLRVEKATRALNKALEGNKVQLTDAQKIAVRYRIIMKDSADAQGDMKRTADSAANAQRRLTAQIGDLEAKIGKDFLPLKAQFLGFFIEAVHVIDDAAAGIRNMVRDIEKADKTDFGAGPGIKRLMDNLRAVGELLKTNRKLAEDAATNQGKASERSTFENYRSELKAINTRAGGDPFRRMDAVHQKFKDSPVIDTLYRQGYLKTNVDEYLNFDTVMAALNQAIDESAGAQGFDTRDKQLSTGNISDYSDYFRGGNRKTTEPTIKIKPKTTAGSGTGTGTGAGTPRPTGGGYGGSLYSGAARNAAERKAASAAERTRKERERAIAKATREITTQQTQFQRTRRKGEMISFSDILDVIRKTGTSYNAADISKALPRTAMQRSGILAQSDRNVVLEKYQQMLGSNPQAAKIFLDSNMKRIQQEQAAREKEIQAAITAAMERERKTKEKDAKDAEENAQAQQEFQQQYKEYGQGLVDAARDAWQQSRDHYRDFLAADAEDLRYRQEMAQTAGDMSASLKLRQALFDNATRQANADFQEALLASNGNFDAVVVAVQRRDSALNAVQRDTQQGLAGDILGMTPDSLRQGVRGVAGDFLRSAAGGGNALDSLKDALGSAGQIAGDLFAESVERRFLDSQLSKLFDGWAAKLAAGGMQAGAAIGASANAFASVVQLLTAQNGKRKSGGLFGALLGAGIGFFTGGVGAAVTGLGIGSKLGQGDILGAALAYGMGTIGAPKAGKINWEAGTMPRFASGGLLSAGRLARVGEMGDELAFSMSRIGILGNGFFQPKENTTIVPAAATKRILQAAGDMVSGGGGSGTRQVIANYYGDVYDRQDVETNERHLKMMQMARAS